MEQALAEQDCLYTLVERNGNSSCAQIIGSLKEYIFGFEHPEAVFAKLADPDIRIVSLTATEGGYCFDANTGQLDLNHAGVVNDLKNPDRPRTIFGYLAEGLDRRREGGTAPFTVLSCDNLQGNGQVAKRTLLAFCAERNKDLSDWIALNGSFPNSMVDRITPATTDAERRFVRETFALDDSCPVVAESFRQWVIEDEFCNGRPPLEQVGVHFTPDVAPYEKMKIRLLNAGHSALGYLGYLCGYRYIHEIAQDPDFRGYLKELMDVEVTPLVGTVPGIDLADYKQSLIERFSNEAIADQAMRICIDGSAKMPKFVLPSIIEQIERGGPISRLTLCVASWIRFLAGRDEDGNEIPMNDPQAERITAIVRAYPDDPRPLLELKDIFANMGSLQRFVDELDRCLKSLYQKGARQTLRLCAKESAESTV